MNKKKVMFIIPHLGSGGAGHKVDWNKKQWIRSNVPYATQRLKKGASKKLMFLHTTTKSTNATSAQTAMLIGETRKIFL